MAILGFQEFMLPILKSFADNQEHSLKETTIFVEEYFQLTEEEKQALVPSGVQRIVYNRTTWAMTYLRKAVLVKTVKRGRNIITERGLELLESPPDCLNMRYLADNYPEYSQNKEEIVEQNIISEAKDIHDFSPEEIIDSNFEIIQSSLSSELLELILQNSPTYFEKLVIDLLVGMGYGGNRKEAGQAVGKSGDEGIDGVINEDRLGLDNIYVQAKRWAIDNTVGRPEIQKFVGALAGKQASKGIFITTSSFSSEARSYVQSLQPKVILIDGRELTQFMIEYDVGVSTYNTYVIKKIDTDYFEEV